MTTATSTNGRGRKSLASQIDRLDQVLDGLAENLNEAVATAVKEAVQATLVELVTNPVVRARLQGTVPPAAPPAKPSLAGRLGQALGRVQGWVGARLAAAREAAGRLISRGRQTCAAVGRQARQGFVTLLTRLVLVRRYAAQLLAALAVGLAVGVAAYFAGPWLSATVGTAGGFVTALTVRAGVWLQRSLGPAMNTAGT